MPLPASKLLWEARNAKIWRTEVETWDKSNEIFGLMRDGQLVRLVQPPRYGEDRKTSANTLGDTYHGQVWEAGESWIDWVAGMDAFGYLVMIAASLV
jgi:hypothetical protein